MSHLWSLAVKTFFIQPTPYQLSNKFLNAWKMEMYFSDQYYNHALYQNAKNQRLVHSFIKIQHS